MNLTFSAEFYPCGKPPPGRGAIVTLERMLKALPPEEQLDLDSGLTHYFAPGLYARRLDRKAGTMIVGKIHKLDHLAMVLYGTMTIVDEFGRHEVTGPHIFVSKAGAKRATYAHTDAAMVTFHPTEETDLARIEDQVTAASFEEFEQFLLEKQT